MKNEKKVLLQVMLAFLILPGCGGEMPDEILEDDIATQSKPVTAKNLSVTGSYYQTVKVFPVLMRIYNSRQITSNGTVHVKIKLRGKTKAGCAVKIGGKVVFTKLRIEASSSHNYERSFPVKAGSSVIVGEKGGKIDRVHFQPAGSLHWIPLGIVNTFIEEIVPAQVRFRIYSSSPITSAGKIRVKIKLRGKELDVAAVRINGKLVWKYWRISSKTRNIVRDFSVPKGASVHVGEYSGKIEYVSFTPSASSAAPGAGACGKAVLSCCNYRKQCVNRAFPAYPNGKYFAQKLFPYSNASNDLIYYRCQNGKPSCWWVVR